ncbi:hypothetical protein K438DRAFT_2007582 [Mycena galopus ATCC 62051]|nr:hypothetical protein K438DRAFT_2007582 [Mycena galopus ATCC 62051]
MAQWRPPACHQWSPVTVCVLSAGKPCQTMTTSSRRSTPAANGGRQRLFQRRVHYSLAASTGSSSHSHSGVIVGDHFEEWHRHEGCGNFPSRNLDQMRNAATYFPLPPDPTPGFKSNGNVARHVFPGKKTGQVIGGGNDMICTTLTMAMVTPPLSRSVVPKIEGSGYILD